MLHNVRNGLLRMKSYEKVVNFFSRNAIVSAVLLYCLSFTFVDTHGDFKAVVECSLCTAFSKLSRFQVARFSRTYCFVGITRVHDIYDE